MLFIANRLRAEYGDMLPVYIWNCEDHRGTSDTDKNFYQEILKSIRAPEGKARETSQILRTRVINIMQYAAINTKTKRIILMIDEAQWVTEKDYGWLIGLYNELNLMHIQLVVFLFGQPELKSQKNDFIRRNKRQIVGRFMIKEYEFKGIRNCNTMMLFLESLNSTMNYKETSDDSDRFNLTKTLFPKAYADNKSLSMLGEPLWNAFQEISAKYHISTNEIPVRYVVDALSYCFLKYSTYSKDGEVFPCKEDLLVCVKESGYLSGEQIDIEFEEQHGKSFVI